MEEKDISQRQPVSEERKRKQEQRKRLRLMIDISAIILVVLLAVLLFFHFGGKDDLAGTWGANDTFFEFNGKGKGVWIQGDEIEKYTYEINRDTVSVDFKRENVRDLTYTFSIEDGKLTLIDSAGQALTMDRIK